MADLLLVVKWLTITFCSSNTTNLQLVYYWFIRFTIDFIYFHFIVTRIVLKNLCLLLISIILYEYLHKINAGSARWNSSYNVDIYGVKLILRGAHVSISMFDKMRCSLYLHYLMIPCMSITSRTFHIEIQIINVQNSF